MEKTAADMKIRLNQLRGMRPNLSLRLSAELDAIQNYGLEGWLDFLKRRTKYGTL